MKPAIVLSLSLLALPALGAAQSLANSRGSVSVTTLDGAAPQTTVAVMQVAGCPVAMQAKQGSGSGLVMVRRHQPVEAQPPNESKPSQHIHLILGKAPNGALSDPRQITGGRVTVKGLSAREHFSLAFDAAGNRSSDLRRTVNATFSTDKDGGVSADLILPGFTAINTVKLESVELKDGSTWAVDDVRACVVTPDPIMLIANE